MTAKGLRNAEKPWFMRLVAGLSPLRPGIDPMSVHVGFVVDRMAMGQVFFRLLNFSPVSFQQ
jgi:hypothetical protein